MPRKPVDAIERDVAEIKRSEHRTQDSLEAVHGTVEHVVDRLAMIESGIHDGRAHAAQAPRKRRSEPAAGDTRARAGRGVKPAPLAEASRSVAAACSCSRAPDGGTDIGIRRHRGAARQHGPHADRSESAARSSAGAGLRGRPSRRAVGRRTHRRVRSRRRLRQTSRHRRAGRQAKFHRRRTTRGAGRRRSAARAASARRKRGDRCGASAETFARCAS